MAPIEIIKDMDFFWACFDTLAGKKIYGRGLTEEDAIDDLTEACAQADRSDNTVIPEPASLFDERYWSAG